MNKKELVKLWEENKPFICCGEVATEKDDGSFLFHQCDKCAAVANGFKYELHLEDD